MRIPVVSVIAVFALCVLPTISGEPNRREDDRDILEIMFDRNVQRSLRSGTIIGGNLITGTDWYVLGASEISAVRAIRKHRRPPLDPAFMPEYPLPPYTVVLWGVADGNVVPAHTLMVSRSVSMFLPLDEGGGGYVIAEGKERDCLRKLIERIQQGKEQPVVKAQAAGSLPDSAK